MMSNLHVNSTETKSRRSADATGSRKRCPCSLAQKRFWVLEQLDPGNPSLNVAVRWRLEGEVFTAELEEAWRIIIDRHEILRTVFGDLDGEPIQWVQPRGEFHIPVIDLTTLSGSAAAAEAERIARLEASAAFDLTRGPLFRVTRLQLHENVSVLLLTAHHIVCDGWSIGLLAREMGQICAAHQLGRQPALPDLPVSYGTYASWQQGFLAEADMQAEAAFWKRSLQGLRHFELLPDRTRPPVQTSNGNIRSVLLDRTLTDRVGVLARESGCTLFMTSLAALLVLLHRHTGETDIALGTQVVGRDEVELEDLVGLFINTLVLRFDVSGDPPFLDLLDRVRDTVSDAFDNRHMPLERVIEFVNPTRDLSRNALFSINFIFQRSFIKNETYGRFRLVDMPSCSAGAMYDLNFFMVERPDGWRASCEYNTDLFDAATIDGLLGRFEMLLRDVAADPARTISAQPILSEADRHELLVDRNRTAAAYPSDQTVPMLLAAQVSRAPDAAAVICDGQVMTYRQLEAAVEETARRLSARGLGPGSRVAVFLDRSPDLIVSLLAVLTVGAAYIPLDPTYPADRLSFVIAQSRLSACITRTSLSTRLPSTGVTTFLVDATDAEPAHGPSPERWREPSTDDAAYVIYTSGSTGQPKGVQISHRSLVNLLWAMRDSPGLTSKDTLVAVTTISFDIAALEMFLPLIVGARLVIAREAETADGAALLGLIRRSDATVMQATPITWQLLIEAGWRGNPRLKMLCGGEALPRVLANKLLEFGELWNMYGPTETTIWSAACRVEPGDGMVPIGPPIANTQFYVLDDRQEPVPPGVPGELYIGGDGIALGYFDRPDLNRERFVADRFTDRPGATMYRTGDLVRWRGGRAIEFLGRNDHQIKLRGFRIELGEIEAALRKRADIVDAVAVAARDRAGEPMIRAYLECAAGTDAAPDWRATLTTALSQSLPSYMIPPSIVVLPALPRMPNGKVDRNALPAPDDLGGVPAGPAPSLTPTEQRLARIWSSVLGIETIDPSAGFFELGGHSLLAVRLLARIETEFERQISLATLFKVPSLRDLARLLEQREQRELDFSQVVKLKQTGSKPPLVALNNTGFFYTLSRRLGSDQPMTALQLFDPAMGGGALPDRFEDIAAGYARLIRRVQPEGPYSLLGWCIGGALAFEVAHQLTAQGQEVPHLIILNAWVPGYLRRLPRHRALLADNAYRLHTIQSDWSKVRAGEESVTGFLGQRNKVAKLAGLFKPSDREATADLARIRRDAELYDGWLLNHLRRAGDRYEPRPYAGRTLIVRASDEPKSRFLDPSLGWAEFLTGDVQVVEVPGNHTTILQPPGVQFLAQSVSTFLDASTARAMWGIPATPAHADRANADAPSA